MSIMPAADITLPGLPLAPSCGLCGAPTATPTPQTRSEYLHGAVRTGQPGAWTYAMHPNTEPDGQRLLWCGVCTRGLAHKHERYSDTNLSAMIASAELRLELDPIDNPTEPDDPAIAFQKEGIATSLLQLVAEQDRRAGLVPDGYQQR